MNKQKYTPTKTQNRYSALSESDKKENNRYTPLSDKKENNNRYTPLSDKKDIKLLFDFESYFKDQEKIKLQDIEKEKLYKPSNLWIHSLIPIVF